MGGCSLEDLRGYIAQEGTALGFPGAPGDLVDTLSTALPSDHERCSPILPDLIGEAVVVHQLKLLPLPAQGNFISRWLERSHPGVTETLVRTIQDYLDEEAPIRWLKTLLEKDSDISTLFQISSALPENSVRLQNLNVDLHDQIARKLGPGGVGSTFSNTITVTENLSRLAKAYAIAGNHEESCRHFPRVVKLRREVMLAGVQHTIEIAPSLVDRLAWTLSCLGNELSELGRHQEACEAGGEAVELNRQLVSRHPGHAELALALSLNNFANSLRELKRFQEAYDANSEAINIYRECAARGEDIGLNLAQSLNNLGSQLGALGRIEEANVAATEAVHLYREAAAAAPDASGLNWQWLSITGAIGYWGQGKSNNRWQWRSKLPLYIGVWLPPKPLFGRTWLTPLQKFAIDRVGSFELMRPSTQWKKRFPFIATWQPISPNVSDRSSRGISDSSPDYVLIGNTLVRPFIISVNQGNSIERWLLPTTSFGQS